MPTKEKMTKGKSAHFPIVGIGASAGGLEAFEQFFKQTPTNSSMAFVLVPHLDPSHGSLLVEILQRSTSMPVLEALDQVAVQPNCVYIIPPNRDMDIFHGKLHLSIPSAPRGQRMPIDAFFRSLAEDQKENAIGIVLSGTGTDGTLGLRAIIGVGGITLVQEPTTAKYDGMPSSAIKAGYATHILPADKMLEKLVGFGHFVAHIDPIATQVSTKENGITQILILLRNIVGHDFSLYKKSTIVRRIERRMLRHSIEDTSVYASYIKDNPGEARILFKELLINLTCFFRDTQAFTVLEKEILPQLCQGKTDNDVFRVWIAGCATGEEAYSIAILLREFMTETRQSFNVQLYSTDLDDDAVAVARAGFYPPNIVQDVSSERLHRFFTKEESGYRISKDIREMVVFAVQNIIKDPPFTRLDLLSCRNVMIYLTQELQNRLITMFNYALKPNGVLFLSPSESIGNHSDKFTIINRKWKFYRALSGATTKTFSLMNNSLLSWSMTPDNHKIRSEGEIVKNLNDINIAELTRRVLVQFFAPASVVTDSRGDILYVHGETGKYLRPPPGQATLNIIDMAREGLELELRAMMNSVVRDGIPILNRELQVKTNGSFSTVSLSVRSLAGTLGSDSTQNKLLVSFVDILTANKMGRKPMSKPLELGRIDELERDIAYLKESYQITIEELQAANEELKSTNEEMQSTNEELQSTNEELETSKEELQSVNEEIITVNSELQAKIEQLADIQNDMKNLLDNINIGIIFLDQNLIIRRFTREAVRIYRLVASDVGRELIDIKSIVDCDGLLIYAQTVLDTLIPYEREICSDSETWLARIQPYRTLDNMIDGVVLTFTNITSRVRTNQN